MKTYIFCSRVWYIGTRYFRWLRN